MAMKNKLTIAVVFGSGLFAAELTTVILVATLPSMPRLWKFIRTGDRNSQRCPGSERRLYHPSWSRKLGRPINAKEPITSTDAIPLGASYWVLQDKKKAHPSGELEMQIMRTDSYEVTNGIKTPK
ncbi:MAG: hypothetical protein OHK93_000111 [Ramalina farinacea]|uniref:Uncharacterized protein n=1 Tax=Ramalina farinacea TaxID=258253 RepID=A0AA43QE81_9LECA|nr:hypothetical protein [Ramalina farinacea]